MVAAVSDRRILHCCARHSDSGNAHPFHRVRRVALERSLVSLNKIQGETPAETSTETSAEISGENNVRLIGIVFGLSLACFAAYQQFKLPVVLPALLLDYGYDRILAGGFMSVYALAGLFLSLPLASAIARHGVQRLVVIALVLMIAGCLLALAKPEAGWLVLIARGLEGVGFAVLAVSGPVLASANASGRQLPVVAGLSAAWIPVGQLSATVLAPVALATVGWKLLWYLGMAGAVAFIVCILSSSTVKAALNSTARTAPSSHRASPATSPLSAHQVRSFVFAGVVFMLWSGQYFAYMTWLPQYLVDQYGTGLADAQWGYAIPVTLVMVLCVITGKLIQRGVSLGALLVTAMATQVAVWWLLPYTGVGALGLVSLVVYGVGAGIIPACLFALPGTIMRGGKATARGFGIIMTGRNMGVLIGPVLLAQAFKLTDDWSLASPIFGVLTTLCLVASVLLARSLRLV